MQRPTCKSCPYWDGSAPRHFTHDPWGERHDEEGDPAIYGYCMRHAPRPVVTPDHEAAFGRHHMPIYPVMCSGDYCGEHPDFPAYIASLMR